MFRQQFRDLYGVGGGAFARCVADALLVSVKLFQKAGSGYGACVSLARAGGHVPPTTNSLRLAILGVLRNPVVDFSDESR